MSTPSQRRPSARRSWATGPKIVLLLLAALLVGAAALGWAGFVAADHDRTLAETERELVRQTALLEEHARRTIEPADALLLLLANRLAGTNLAAMRGSAAASRELTAMAERLPEIGTLSILDRDGDVVSSNWKTPPAAQNFADRPYHRVHRYDAEAGLFIGELQLARVSRQRIFTLSRAIRDSDGSLVGVAVASLRTDYFQDFYQRSGLGEGGSAAILRRDGALLVREPLPQEMIGIIAPSTDRGLSRDAPLAVSVMPSPLDGVERVVARRLMSNYPLVVLASRTVDAAFAGWRARMAQTGAVALAVIVLGAALGWLGLRGQRQQDAMEAELRRSSAILESRVEDRTASLEATNADLQRTVGERDLLLREVYHRVKNNMQQVDAMISLQLRGLSTEEARRALHDMRLRVNALGMVHQQLLSAADLETLSLRTFLTDLCRGIAYASGGDARGITLELDVAPEPIDFDHAIPLGLLVNELVSNAFKHAFPDGRRGAISVHAHRGDGRLAVVVADNGVGYDVQAVAPGSAGSRIIRALCLQLRATADTSCVAGTRWSLSIPLEEEMQDA